MALKASRMLELLSDAFRLSLIIDCMVSRSVGVIIHQSVLFAGS